MKLGCMGAHGTGKSTFALRLAASLKDLSPDESVGVLLEAVRSCPWPVNKQTTDEAQRWIFHRQMIEELELSARNEIVICDRTILDPLAYSERAGLGDLVDAYMPAALEWMETYDEIYFLRPNGIIAADGFRDTDPQFQKEIDAILERYVNAFGISVAQVILDEKELTGGKA